MVNYALIFIVMTIPSLMYSYLFGRFVLVFDVFLLIAIGWLQNTKWKSTLHLFSVFIFLSSLLIGFNISPENWGDYLLGLIDGNFAGGVIYWAIPLLAAYSLLPIVIKIDRINRKHQIIFTGLFIIFLCVRLIFHGTQNSPTFRTTLGTTAVSVASSFTSESYFTPKIKASTNDFNSLSKNPDGSSYALFVLESWGERKETLDQLVEYLKRSSVSVRIDYGFVGYRGSTIHGEIRSLCGIITKPSLMTEDDYLDCAPRRFKIHGYESTALHGYISNYYGRSLIWKKMGFESHRFSDSFNSSSFCDGAYYGVCDSKLISEAFNLLEKSGNRFVYALTLEAHEPVNSMSLRDLGPSKFISYDSKSQVINRKNIEQLLHLVQKSPKKHLKVYAYGDHNPPSLRGALGYGDFVPYIIFTKN